MTFFFQFGRLKKKITPKSSKRVLNYLTLRYAPADVLSKWTERRADDLKCINRFSITQKMLFRKILLLNVAVWEVICEGRATQRKTYYSTFRPGILECEVMILTVNQINIKVSLGMAVSIIPRRIKNRGYDKFGWQTRCIMEDVQMENGLDYP